MDKFLSLSSSGSCDANKACVSMDLKDRMTSYVLLLFIMAFALVWEGTLQILERFCPSQLKPTVERVVLELAELGLVSLLVYIPSESAWFFNLSSSLFGNCHRLLALVHKTHFLVFYGMFSFLVFVISITLSGMWWLRQWRSFEASALRPPKCVEVQRHFARTRFLWFQYVFFAGSSRIDYRLMRRQFLREVNTDDLRRTWEVEMLPAHFEFNTYLKRQQSMFYERVVSITLFSWITLFIVIGICYFTLYLELWMHTTLVTVAQAFLLLASLATHVYCVWLYQRLFNEHIQDTVPTIKSTSRLQTLTEQGDTGSKEEVFLEIVHDGAECVAPLQADPDESGAQSSLVQLLSKDTTAASSMTPLLGSDDHHAGVLLMEDCDRITSGRRTPSTLPSPERISQSSRPSSSLTPMPSLRSAQSTLRSTGFTLPHSTDNHLAVQPPPYGRRGSHFLRSSPNSTAEETTDVAGEVEMEKEEEGADAVRHTGVPKNHVATIRYAIQVIILLTGLNNAFFMDLSGPYLIERCRLSGPSMSYIVFALHILMVIGQVSSLLQTIRINTFLCSTASNKNYASISWVLHQMELRAMLQHLKEQYLGDREYSTSKALANDLFDRLDIDKNGVVSAQEVHLCLLEVSRDYTLSAHDVLGVIRHMDSDGDGYISRKDFLKECRFILEH